jgi:hypothetical protein
MITLLSIGKGNTSYCVPAQTLKAKALVNPCRDNNNLSDNKGLNPNFSRENDAYFFNEKD